jgi:hypothetical protein
LAPIAFLSSIDPTTISSTRRAQNALTIRPTMSR